MAKVFSREATGLIREVGFLDAFLLNLAVVNIAGGLAYDILQLFFFPGASLPLVFLLGGIPAFGIFLVYTSLSIIFPRTGGDYVYISRIVHPTAGMANAWLNTLGFFLFTLTGFNAWYVVYTGLPSLLTSLAVSTGDMGYARIASFIQTNITFDFALSTIVLIIGACIVMFGLKVFKWAFRLIFVYYFLSAALLAALLLVTNHNMFINAIGKDTYSHVISSASQMGVYRFSLTETLLAAVPLGFLTFTGFQSSVYIGSEVKNVKRNQTLALGVSMLLTWVYLVVLAYAASNIFSNSFLQAASYLWATKPGAMPFSATPFITFLLSIIYRNPAIAFLLNSVPVVGGFLLIPSTILASSRILFALSFDRILPEWVSRVNERLRSPVYSVILMMVIAEIWVVVLYFFGYISTWLSLSLATPLAWSITAIAAIVLPFSKLKSNMQVLPRWLRAKPLGVPVMVWGGVIQLAGMIAWLASMFSPIINYLYLGPLIYSAIGVSAGIIVLSLVLYYGALLYRRRQGFDLSLVFREIPPE